MADGVIDIGRGVTLSPCTEEEFAYVNANLRDGDRAEREVCGSGKECVSACETLFTIRDGGNVVGYIGTVCDGCFGPESRGRFMVMMSTTYADRIKVKYCRMGRKAVAALFSATPPWVDRLVTITMKSYAGAVRYVERVLGMRRLADFKISGVEHVAFGTSKEETMEGLAKGRVHSEPSKERGE